VTKAIEELGYRPNMVARELRNTRSRNIGVVMPDLAYYAYWDSLRSIESYAELNGYAVFLGDSARDPAREQALLERSLERRVAGLIVHLIDQTPAIVTRISAENIPIVSLGSQEITGEGPILRLPIDIRDSLDSAIRRLHELGHVHIGVCTSQGSYLQRERLQIVQTQAVERELRLSVFSFGPDAPQAEGLAAAFEIPNPLTAVLVLDSDLTPLVLAGLADANVPIPEDVSVVTVGHSHWLQAFRPALAVVRSAIHPRGLFAIRQLLAMIEGRPIETPPLFRTEFIENDSLGPAPRRAAAIASATALPRTPLPT